MALQAGEILEGKYRIVRPIGEGGMGAVYEGENTRIRRRVAIKVLHAAVAAKADVVQRFEREAQAAGTIGSEHIVEVLDIGNLPSGERFMVMEFLEGEDLTSRIKHRGRLTPQECVPLCRQVLEGLGAAHDAQIIHRDLKPDNIFILHSMAGRRDFVKLLDFGVSKFSALDSEMSMTRTGAVMGTPYYMSPEQAKGGKIDARSDLYSAGVVLYQMVTGRVPFNAASFNELLFKIALDSPDPIAHVVPDCPPSFVAIVEKAMAREPHDRFQTALAFQQALDQWLLTGNSTEHRTDVTRAIDLAALSQAHGLLGLSQAHATAPPGLAQSGYGAPPASAVPHGGGSGYGQPVVPAYGQSHYGPDPVAPGPITPGYASQELAAPAASHPKTAPLPAYPSGPTGPPAFAPHSTQSPGGQPPPQGYDGLGQSQIGLAVPPQPPPKTRSPALAIVAAIGAATLVAGGVGFWVWSHPPAGGASASSDAESASGAAETPADGPASADGPEVGASASTEPDAPDPPASAEPTAAPSASGPTSVVAVAPPTTRRPPPSGTMTRPPATSPPASPPPPQPKTGRTIKKRL